MTIGALIVKLRLPENHSLKSKRQVLRSVTAQVKNKFNVSIAEVGDHDLWQITTLGVALASNEARYANEVLSKVVSLIENARGDAELVDYEIELVHVF